MDGRTSGGLRGSISVSRLVGLWATVRVHSIGTRCFFCSQCIRYEHVGVVVQERLLLPDNDTTKHAKHQIIEIKVHVVFGELAGGRLEAIPSLSEPVDIAYCGDQIHYIPRYISPWAAYTAKHDFLRNEAMLRTHTETIRAMGKAIAELYGADWFRLDVFVGPNGWLYINEVTYPSHVFHDDECTVQWLLSKYDDIELIESKAFVSPLLSQLNISWDEFHDTADYHSIRHATDQEYESQFWTVAPPEEQPLEPDVPPWHVMTLCMISVIALAVRFRLRFVRMGFGKLILGIIGHKRRSG